MAFKEAGGEAKKSPQEVRIEKAVKDKQKRIDKAIAHRDQREDARSRQINVSWAHNCAVEMAKIDPNVKYALQKEDYASVDASIEGWAEAFLRSFDRVYEKRSQEQARRYEIEDDELNQAEIDDGENATE